MSKTQRKKTCLNVRYSGMTMSICLHSRYDKSTDAKF